MEENFNERALLIESLMLRDKEKLVHDFCNEMDLKNQAYAYLCKIGKMDDFQRYMDEQFKLYLAKSREEFNLYLSQ